VYADGVFDSFHIGHSNMFKQCREAFPNEKIHLIAGVCDQKDIEEHKGSVFINKDRPSARKRRGFKWWGRINTWMRSTRTRLGFSLKVYATSFRVSHQE
jgi:cytidyltransferase-like protein